MARPSKVTLKRKLDRLAGSNCRAIGECQAYGYRDPKGPKSCTPQLQWCHIKSRRYLSVRWSKNNCLCLCASHHRWFTDNPDCFTYFLKERFPEQLKRLNQEFKTVHPMRAIDMEELYDKIKEDQGEH